ncbi:hypothetical protein ACI75Y_09455 [Capnocytophaga stomatis]|uniref:hypothetical protein n=1 Tax=Capnocytophaga stomatis TaxID=1848904 RepID=UPI00385ED62D
MNQTEKQHFEFNKKYSEKDKTYVVKVKIFHKDEIAKNNVKNKIVNQPITKNYYEFESYENPIRVESIDNLRVYTIDDLRKNCYPISLIWSDTSYSIVFIEKIQTEYYLWEMTPIYEE